MLRARADLIALHPDYTTGRLSRLAIDGTVSGGQSQAVPTEEGGTSAAPRAAEDEVL